MMAASHGGEVQRSVDRLAVARSESRKQDRSRPMSAIVAGSSAKLHATTVLSPRCHTHVVAPDPGSVRYAPLTRSGVAARSAMRSRVSVSIESGSSCCAATLHAAKSPYGNHGSTPGCENPAPGLAGPVHRRAFVVAAHARAVELADRIEDAIDGNLRCRPCRSRRRSRGTACRAAPAASRARRAPGADRCRPSASGTGGCRGCRRSTPATRSRGAVLRRARPRRAARRRRTWRATA